VLGPLRHLATSGLGCAKPLTSFGGTEDLEKESADGGIARWRQASPAEHSACTRGGRAATATEASGAPGAKGPQVFDTDAGPAVVPYRRVRQSAEPERSLPRRFGDRAWRGWWRVLRRVPEPSGHSFRGGFPFPAHHSEVAPRFVGPNGLEGRPFHPLGRQSGKVDAMDPAGPAGYRAFFP
jgi:hypothetical protein